MLFLHDTSKMYFAKKNHPCVRVFRTCCESEVQPGTYVIRQSSGIVTPTYNYINTDRDSDDSFDASIGAQIIPGIKRSQFQRFGVEVQYPCGIKQLEAVLSGKYSYPDVCKQRDPITQACKDTVKNPVCLNPMDRPNGWDLYYNIRYCTKNCVPEWNEWVSVVEDAPRDACDIPWCSRSRTFESERYPGTAYPIRPINFNKQECPAFKVLRRTLDFTVKESAVYGRECEQQTDYCCCPVDCKAEWLEWSPCSVTCGFGTQGRGYTITQAAQCGGRNDCKPQTQYRQCIGTSQPKIITGSQALTYEGGLAKPPTLLESKNRVVQLKKKLFSNVYRDYKPITIDQVTILDCGIPSPDREHGGEHTAWSCYRKKEKGKTYPPGVGECLLSSGDFGAGSIFAKWTQWCHPFGWVDGENVRRSFHDYFDGLVTKKDSFGKVIRPGSDSVKIFWQIQLLGKEVKSCGCNADFLSAGMPPVSMPLTLSGCYQIHIAIVSKPSTLITWSAG